ncbi:NUDIX domain-containing protein (plasmid) [Ensifer adhaerens]|uniref:NUDIX hydrolase n=1 Tax=Ensifer adhaerens TaxID=106592 RepID=UPI0023AA0BF7|nr:NUDIX domain-containing protein [Ensifer adhaerens]WDZ80724.1 NUDIX domain-containing protein [Ensifer adhaerens]
MSEQFSLVCETLPQNAARSMTCVQQAGAICFRTSSDSSPEVLLVTSRRNGRWGIPKGRIEAGETACAAAAREAMEEAGVRGRVSNEAVGSFVYTKDSTDLSYHLNVHLLEVQEILWDFPERESRRLQWTPLEAAIQEVSQPKLRELLLLLAAENGLCAGFELEAQ